MKRSFNQKWMHVASRVAMSAACCCVSYPHLLPPAEAESAQTADNLFRPRVEQFRTSSSTLKPQFRDPMIGWKFFLCRLSQLKLTISTFATQYSPDAFGIGNLCQVNAKPGMAGYSEELMNAAVKVAHLRSCEVELVKSSSQVLDIEAVPGSRVHKEPVR